MKWKNRIIFLAFAVLGGVYLAFFFWQYERAKTLRAAPPAIGQDIGARAATS